MGGKVIVAATEDEWKAQITNAKNGATYMVVDFFAEWCGPCKMISPFFEKLSEKEEYAKIIFMKVDVDQNPVVAESCKITAMPTFQVYNGEGEKVDELVGAAKDKLEALVKKYM